MKQSLAYAHAEIWTQVVVICGPTCYQLDNGGALVELKKHTLDEKPKRPQNICFEPTTDFPEWNKFLDRQMLISSECPEETLQNLQ